MMDFLYNYVFYTCLFVAGIYASTIGRTVQELPGNEGVDHPGYDHVRLIIKRDTSEQSELPAVDGRTFRASQPLDPNAGAPQQLFDDTFETSHVIFEPSVDDNDDTSGVGDASGTPLAATSRDTEGDNDRLDQNDRSSGTSAATDAREATAERANVETEGAVQSRAQATPDGQAGQGGGDASYTPGDLDQPGYIPGVVEAVSTDGASPPDSRPDSQSLTNDGQGQRSNARTNEAVDAHSETAGSTRGGHYQVDPALERQTHPSGGVGTGGTGIDSSYLSGASYPIGSDPYPGEGPVTGVGGATNRGPTSGASGGSGNQGYYDSSGQFVYTGQRPRYTSGGQQHGGGSSDGSRYHGQGHRYDASGRNYDNQRRYYDSSGTYSGHLYGRGTTGGSSTGGGGTQYVDTLSGRYVNYGTQRSTVTSHISSDTVCRPTQTRVTINGHSCTDAISQLGSFVCYNYERVSDECCERCLQVKSPENVGCEYGDRSFQCRNIQPFDCYADRNREICCDSCRRFREQSRFSSGVCVYGDLTPRCQSIMQRSYLCYQPENQRLCCETCPRLAHDLEPDCKWGNQNPELCLPFDDENRVKINCYLPAVQQVCCATCRRLRARMPDDVPNCEYGDSPVQFSTGRGVLDCGQYLRQYGLGECDNPEVAQKCCYTCYRYRAAGRG